MRIYTSEDGNYRVEAITEFDGFDTRGSLYSILSGENRQELEFQGGPVREVGVNGCTNEQIIALLIDRLGVLNEKQQCRENVMAIFKLEEALLWLDKRTKNRRERGVEGTSQP